MGKPDNLVGQIFNYLTVIEKDIEYKKLHNLNKNTAAYWKCKCVCGKETSVRGDALKKGQIISCGCKRLETSRQKQMIDITNQRFGKLVAIEPLYDYAKQIGIKNNGNIIYWKCQCDCGNMCVEPGTELRSGKIQNCSRCKKSKGESKIISILQENNIKYINNEPYFKDLINPNTGYCLRYDFIILDNNNNNPQYLIEYDGEQHFEPILLWGGEERFQYQKQMDMIKNKYAISHKLPLIRIPYTQLKNLTYNDLDPSTSNFIYTTEDGYCHEKIEVKDEQMDLS